MWNFHGILSNSSLFPFFHFNIIIIIILSLLLHPIVYFHTREFVFFKVWEEKLLVWQKSFLFHLFCLLILWFFLILSSNLKILYFFLIISSSFLYRSTSLLAVKRIFNIIFFSSQCGGFMMMISFAFIAKWNKKKFKRKENCLFYGSKFDKSQKVFI